MNTGTPLHPEPKIWLRVAILVVLVALASLSTRSWCAKSAFCLTMAGILGTFPRPRINITSFEKQWFICFVPVQKNRTELADVIQLETDVEEHLGMLGGWFIFLTFGLYDLIFIRLIDWLIPWAGGDYKLWLRMKSGRVLAWQGNGEKNFRRNLEVLEDISGLPVTRG